MSAWEQLTHVAAVAFGTLAGTVLGIAGAALVGFVLVTLVVLCEQAGARCRRARERRRCTGGTTDGAGG